MYNHHNIIIKNLEDVWGYVEMGLILIFIC